MIVVWAAKIQGRFFAVGEPGTVCVASDLARVYDSVCVTTGISRNKQLEWSKRVGGKGNNSEKAQACSFLFHCFCFSPRDHRLVNLVKELLFQQMHGFVFLLPWEIFFSAKKNTNIGFAGCDLRRT